MSARRALARRLANLSSSEQQRAAVALRTLVEKRRAELGLGANLRTDPSRDPKTRLPYVNDPHAYARDILGVTLTSQQERLLDAFQNHRRVIAPSATNVGKSFVAACGILWLFDAVAALPTANGSQQGCVVLLLGPDHATIRATSYARLIEIYKHCASRGVRLPGTPREASVTWRVSERWFVAPVSPPKHVGETVAHAASGRHGPNMVALGEEAIGIQPAVLAAVEGGFNAPGNRIWLPLNPTEMRPHIRERAENGTYHVLSLSALDHPNVRQRRLVVPGAVSLEHVEREIETACREIGPYPDHQPDLDKRDFVYALPPSGADPSLARSDDIPGHLEGTPWVYRPQGLFAAQILGQTPAEGTSGLIDPSAYDRAVTRWKTSPDPELPPDRVGVDCGGGGDPTIAIPAWGLSGRELLRLVRDVEHSAAGALAIERREERLVHLENQLGGLDEGMSLEYFKEVARRQREGIALDDLRRIAEPRTIEEREARALEGLRRTRRIRLGVPVRVPSGGGHDVARWLRRTYPDSPFVVDRDGGDARSIVDYLRESLGADVTGVSFGSQPLPTGPGERPTDCRRAQMYCILAELIRRDLIDLPPDPELRAECLAVQWQLRERFAQVGGVTMQLSGITPKDELRKALGRSTDRADAAVLACQAQAVGVRF